MFMKIMKSLAISAIIFMILASTSESAFSTTIVFKEALDTDKRESQSLVYIRETDSAIYAGNEFLEIGFRKDTGALWSFIDKKSGIDLRGLKTDPGECLWDLRLVTKDLKHVGPSGIRRSFSYYKGYSINKSETEIDLIFDWSKVWLKVWRVSSLSQSLC